MTHFVFEVVEFAPPVSKRMGIYYVSRHVVTSTDYEKAAQAFLKFWPAKPGHRYFVGTEGRVVLCNVRPAANKNWFPQSQLDAQVAWFLDDHKFIEFTPTAK